MSSKIGTRRYRALRLKVLARDGYICQYCNAPATHVDHVLARVHGGTDDMDNLVASCAPCNLKKGSRSVFFKGTATPLVSSSNLSRVTHTTVLASPFEPPSSLKEIK